jgi:uncharacterized membrane protein
MRYLRNRFLTGLLILTPVAVTGWIMWKVFSTVDNILGPFQERYPVIDIPGLGFVVVIAMIILTGILAGNFIGHRVIGLGERVLYRVPLIRRIYHAVKELAGVFLGDRKMVFKEVVLIQYPHPDSFALAFVTEQSNTRLGDIIGRDVVNVFVPTTPNPTSGFLLFVPRERMIRVPIDVEEAMKMVISGGVFIPQELQESMREPTDAAPGVQPKSTLP